jgi:hypothetical protein
VVNGQVFWGQDALPMLRAYLQGDAWFESADWLDVRQTACGYSKNTCLQIIAALQHVEGSFSFSIRLRLSVPSRLTSNA